MGFVTVNVAYDCSFLVCFCSHLFHFLYVFSLGERNGILNVAGRLIGVTEQNMKGWNEFEFEFEFI